MTTITSTELSITSETMDNSRVTINSSSNKLILESNSSDITISKYETPKPLVNVSSTSNSTLAMKTQLVPLVYIPNASKVPFAAVNKSNTNVVVNNIPSLQFATINKNNPVTTTTAINQQNLILATGRPQSLLLQKQQAGVVPIVPVSVSGGAKITGAYLTMLKAFPNANEPNSVNKFQVSSIPHKSTLADISVLNNNGTQISQNPAQKFLIAPMPKVTSNRLPATVTTNSVQPKITVLPMPVPNSEPVVTTQKVYNVKVTDGQLQSDLIGENSYDGESNSGNLICDEIIDLNSPEKTEINNKTYELSITEDSVSSQGDTKSSMIISKCSNKEALKFPKHGVSILKKNYFLERRIEKPNNLVTINNGSLNSLSENKESSTAEESVIITIPQKPEKERRRKSNFSYRKDFDDMEVIINNNSIPNSTDKNDNMQDPLKLEDPRKKLTSEIEIELIKEKSEENSTNSQEDIDFQKLLDWDDGIGTLPGSTLKFIIDEFNILEYITEDEYKTIIEKRITKAKEKMIAELQEELRCVECGCYGLPSEFIHPKYCSLDCQDMNQSKQKKEAMKAEKYKNKKKKQHRFRSEDSVVKMEKKHETIEDDISEEDSADNSSTIQDKFYPWSCKKKGFSWSKYLDHIKAKPAPVKLFKDPFPYNRNGFRPGMKLEGVDPQHPSYFCVFSVAEVVGYRMRLHFDGYSENYDFWCNADTMDIFPMGWCEKHGHTLQPPSGYTVENFNWVQYLRSTKSIAAPKHLFANRAGQAICPNGFRIGMKLEAVDRKNTSLVCVATVRDMMDNRILVHFDSWDDIYDYWTDPTSPYIHPVGWCDQYGHNLTPPIDYPNPETFSWEVYLKITKSVAAPVRAFKQRPACGFKRGMRLECVDKRVPQLIRVATVDDVKEHQIRIHFDGWIDRYSYWVDDDSPDIHPVGWCQKTGHPLEPPLTPDDVYDFVDCRTIGCKGMGHVDGPRYATHSSQKHCPYAEENIYLDRVLPDRLLSPDRSPEEAVPVSREPKECKIKPRVGRPPKYLHLERPKPEPEDEPPEKKPKRKYIKRIKSEILESSEEQKARNFIEQSNIVPAEHESWNKHSRFLKKYVSTDADPRLWSYREVINFISSIPCCEENTDIFKRERIDGEALLSLSQKDILTILKLKVGPAVKLYNSIVLLRQQVKEEMCT